MHSESDVQNAVERIEHRLKDPGDLPFYNYGLIAAALITIKHNLKYENEKNELIDAVKQLMIENLRGRNDKLREEEIFIYGLNDDATDIRKEYTEFRERMVEALNEGEEKIQGFDYWPDQASIFKKNVSQNLEKYYKLRGFARYLDVDKLATMFSLCNPSQKNDIREAFISIYSSHSAREYFSADIPALNSLLTIIKAQNNAPNIDRVQMLQTKWFSKYIKDTILQIRPGNKS